VLLPWYYFSKPNIMVIIGNVKVKLLAFMISASDGGELSLMLQLFIPVEKDVSVGSSIFSVYKMSYWKHVFFAHIFHKIN